MIIHEPKTVKIYAVYCIQGYATQVSVLCLLTALAKAPRQNGSNKTQLKKGNNASIERAPCCFRHTTRTPQALRRGLLIGGCVATIMTNLYRNIF